MERMRRLRFVSPHHKILTTAWITKTMHETELPFFQLEEANVTSRQKARVVFS